MEKLNNDELEKEIKELVNQKISKRKIAEQLSISTVVQSQYGHFLVGFISLISPGIMSKNFSSYQYFPVFLKICLRLNPVGISKSGFNFMI